MDVGESDRRILEVLDAIHEQGERVIWTFEGALRVARGGADLLPHFLAATACLLARAEETTPRGVLKAFFRRSASDEVWRSRYLPLFK